MKTILVIKMEIKTAEQLQVKKLDDWDKQFYSGLWLNKKWVAVSDILQMIENLRKTGDMYRYSADDLFTMLEKAIKWGEEKNERR